MVAAVAALASTSAFADGPGRGITANFEVPLMEMIIDHHYSALRMTELAAGTDVRRTGNLSPGEGTSPSPGFPPSQAKASIDEVKSNARMENRAQREQILQLQSLLRDWYGINYQPQIRSEQQAAIGMLEHAQPGKAFDRAYLEVFSHHHYQLFKPLNGCMTGVDRRHHELIRLCNEMWHAQTSAVDEMRELLAKNFGIADYQPFSDASPLQTEGGSLRGQHSSGQ
ncbi:putative lipoprotein [Burkholderia sp. SJ98]|nr:putative lipoprotein [Burkholderia sp. SJ98]